MAGVAVFDGEVAAVSMGALDSQISNNFVRSGFGRWTVFDVDVFAAPEGGARYPVTSSLAGRMFTKFHLDVGIGDATVRPTEILSGRDWLGFAGIAPVPFMAISKEQQFAEKLHAYTLPRESGVNSRVKDLVDMALLARMEAMDGSKLKEAIEATFNLRGTHSLPTVLPEPPISWARPYRALADECHMDWTMSESLNALAELLGGIMTKGGK
jgi:hypothetical protein